MSVFSHVGLPLCMFQGFEIFAVWVALYLSEWEELEMY